MVEFLENITRAAIEALPMVLIIGPSVAYAVYGLDKILTKYHKPQFVQLDFDFAKNPLYRK